MLTLKKHPHRLPKSPRSDLTPSDFFSQRFLTTTKGATKSFDLMC